MYFQNMELTFQKIPVKLTKPISLKEIRKNVLHVSGGEWYTNKLNEKLPLPKKQKLSKKR